MSSLLAVRHAQSVWNAEGRWQGRADPPLSALGEEQAEAGGRRLAELPVDHRPTVVVASGLRRARQTATALGAAIGLTDPPGCEPDLGEFDVGAWSGLTRAEIEVRFPGTLAAWEQGRLDATPDGESRQAFDVRVSAAIRRVLHRHADQRVLVVCHGGVIRSLARTTGRGEQPVGHLAGYRGRLDQRGLTLTRWVDLLAGQAPAPTVDDHAAGWAP